MNIARDSGYTLADRVPGSYFCVHFARGSCTQGPQCQYLHRLPTIHDMFNPNVDVFGREKHSDYKEDMSGVGSFMRVNRTLYVGRCHVTGKLQSVHVAFEVNRLLSITTGSNVFALANMFGQMTSRRLSHDTSKNSARSTASEYSLVVVLVSSHTQQKGMPSLPWRQWQDRV